MSNAAALPDDFTVSANLAAVLLGVSPLMVRRLVRDGVLVDVRPPGGTLRCITAASIAAYRDLPVLWTEYARAKGALPR